MNKPSLGTPEDIISVEGRWHPVSGNEASGLPPQMECYLDGRLGDPEPIANGVLHRLEDAASKLHLCIPVLSVEEITCTGRRVRDDVKPDDPRHAPPPSRRIQVDARVLCEARKQLRKEKTDEALAPAYKWLLKKDKSFAEQLIRENDCWTGGDTTKAIDLSRVFVDQVELDRVAAVMMRILTYAAKEEGAGRLPVREGSVIRADETVRLMAAVKIAQINLKMAAER